MWGFRQLRTLEELGDELGYLRYDLVSLAKGRFRESWRELATQDGEARLIEAMDMVFIYPSASVLLGGPSEERIPYTVNGETVYLPTPERLMDLLFMNFYTWDGRVIFRSRDSEASNRQVWMSVDKEDELVSHLGLCLRRRPHSLEISQPISYVMQGVFSPESCCGDRYQPLSALLAGSKNPPDFVDGNPLNLKSENLKLKKRGRPMKCTYCGKNTTKEDSQVIDKKRHCLRCLGYAVRRHGITG